MTSTQYVNDASIEDVVRRAPVCSLPTMPPTRSLALIIGVTVLCKSGCAALAETDANCVPESEFTQYKCRCKRYTGYNVVRNDSATNSTVLLGCPVPTVCVGARANAGWTLSGFNAGSLVLNTGPEGPVLLSAIDGFTVGPRNGVAIDASTGHMFVRTDIPKLLLKVNCSVTVYVFPPTSVDRAPPATDRESLTIVKTTTTTTREITPARTTTRPATMVSTVLTTLMETILITAPTETPTFTVPDEDESHTTAASRVPFGTFADSIPVTVPLISNEDQTPLFIILGLLILCLALSLLLAVLYAQGAFGHRGGQWDALARKGRFHLPKSPRPLEDHGIPEIVLPALP